MKLNEEFTCLITRTIAQLRLELLRSDKSVDDRIQLVDLLDFFNAYGDALDSVLLIMERRDVSEFDRGLELLKQIRESNGVASKMLAAAIDAQGMGDLFKFFFGGEVDVKRTDTN